MSRQVCFAHKWPNPKFGVHMHIMHIDGIFEGSNGILFDVYSKPTTEVQMLFPCEAMMLNFAIQLFVGTPKQGLYWSKQCQMQNNVGNLFLQNSKTSKSWGEESDDIQGGK